MIRCSHNNNNEVTRVLIRTSEVLRSQLWTMDLNRRRTGDLETVPKRLERAGDFSTYLPNTREAEKSILLISVLINNISSIHYLNATKLIDNERNERN